MPRMIDLIRASAVPASLLQAAARGALSLPPREMLEVLVHLASNGTECSQQARQTLAGWNNKVLQAAVCDPRMSAEVLEYFVHSDNLRADVLPDLLESAALKDESLANLAATASRDTIDILLASPRVCGSQELLAVLNANSNLSGIQAMAVAAKLAPAVEESAVAASSAAASSEARAIPDTASAPVSATSEPAPDPALETKAEVETKAPEVPISNPADPLPADASAPAEEPSDENVSTFITEHAAELATVEEKPYQPLGGTLGVDVEAEIVSEQAMAAAAGVQAGAASSSAADPAKKLIGKKANLNGEEERGSALQKIAKLDIKGRIALAMRGTKEERSLLIRDGTKLVAISVLESPKITDGEVEKFAGQKNVLEAVLRQIPLKRRFLKNYIIVRNLVFNPRTPIDLSLGLMKNLLVGDLKNLSGNKEVSDTIRKLAIKMHRQKANPSGKKTTD
jgi:hypothetical protein